MYREKDNLILVKKLSLFPGKKLSLEENGFITVRFSYRNHIKVELKQHTLKKHHLML